MGNSLRIINIGKLDNENTAAINNLTPLGMLASEEFKSIFKDYEISEGIEEKRVGMAPFVAIYIPSEEKNDIYGLFKEDKIDESFFGMSRAIEYCSEIHEQRIIEGIDHYMKTLNYENIESATYILENMEQIDHEFSTLQFVSMCLEIRQKYGDFLQKIADTEVLIISDMAQNQIYHDEEFIKSHCARGIKFYKKLIEYSGELPYVEEYNNLGFLSLNMNKLEEAEAYFEKAKNNITENEEALLNIINQNLEIISQRKNN